MRLQQMAEVEDGGLVRDPIVAELDTREVAHRTARRRASPRPSDRSERTTAGGSTPAASSPAASAGARPSGRPWDNAARSTREGASTAPPRPSRRETSPAASASSSSRDRGRGRRAAWASGASSGVPPSLPRGARHARFCRCSFGGHEALVFCTAGSRGTSRRSWTSQRVPRPRGDEPHRGFGEESCGSPWPPRSAWQPRLAVRVGMARAVERARRRRGGVTPGPVRCLAVRA